MSQPTRFRPLTQADANVRLLASVAAERCALASLRAELAAEEREADTRSASASRLQARALPLS